MCRDDEIILLSMLAVLIVIVIGCVCFYLGFSLCYNDLQTLCDKKQYDFCIEQKQWGIKVD